MSNPLPPPDHPGAGALPSPTLRAALGRMTLLRLAFAHRFGADARLPPLKGDLWHGVFGACLHDTAPEAYAALFGADEPRRPWALCPPLEFDEWVPAGATVQAGLTLVGAAAVHAPACLAALQAMGERGFGRTRAPAELVGLAALDAGGAPQPPGYAAAPSAREIFERAEGEAAGAARAGLELRLLTPLRLKHEGQVLRAVPPLDLLVRRLLGRLVLLAPQCPGGLFGPGDQAAPLACAARAPLLAHQLDGLRWLRHSSRQRASMPFEGLLGRLVYGPPAASLLPWFALAQWLQMGGKTTFGLGVVQARAVAA